MSHNKRLMFWTKGHNRKEEKLHSFQHLLCVALPRSTPQWRSPDKGVRYIQRITDTVMVPGLSAHLLAFLCPSQFLPWLGGFHVSFGLTCSIYYHRKLFRSFRQTKITVEHFSCACDLWWIPSVGWKGSVGMPESLRGPQAPEVIPFLWNKLLFWIAQNQSPQSSLALLVKSKISTQSLEHEAWLNTSFLYQSLYMGWWGLSFSRVTMTADHYLG